MKKFLHSPKVQENLIYLALWGLVFAMPLMLHFTRQGGDNSPLSMEMVQHVWLYDILPFFTLFVLHNYFVAPLWLHRGKLLLYLGITVVLLGGFYFANSAMPRPDKFRPEMMSPPEAHFEERSLDEIPPRFQPDRRPKGEFFKMKGFHELTVLISAILMLGMNLLVKLLFRNAQREKEAIQRQQEQLQQQLLYLKHQISPHFFMNTLNNIHALVDIDTEEAKATILQLSRLMRYVLYESEHERVPLSHDIQFMQHYVSLMKIRYTDHVKISFTIPDDLPELNVPPMLFINFVENAFKHGISYKAPSTIDISLEVSDETIHFCCANTKHPQSPETVAHQSHGGLGIANTRRRLDLIYADRYTLDIKETDHRYEVNLRFKVIPDSQTS